MHRPRPASLLALAVAVALAVPAAGSSASGPKRPKDQCSTLVFQNELEAVFGHVKTPAAAQVLLGKVRRVGFANADIIRAGCSDYKVFQRGVETWDIGVDLQDEARQVGLAVTLECVRGKGAGDIQAIIGTRPTNADVQLLAQRARPRDHELQDPPGAVRRLPALRDGLPHAPAGGGVPRQRAPERLSRDDRRRQRLRRAGACAPQRQKEGRPGR